MRWAVKSSFQIPAGLGPAELKKVPKLVIRVVLLLVAAAAPANAAAAVGSSDAMEKCGQNPL